jgi:hypothetical protein
VIGRFYFNATMGYFEKQPGQRPQAQPGAGTQPEQRAALTSTIAGSGLGPRPAVAEPAAPGKQAHHEADPRCPLCRATLGYEKGLWRCAGRCGATWVRIGSQLVDLASLPYGVCSCCELPVALVRAPAGAQCPASGLEYLVLPGGSRLLREAAPSGLCLCCQPPAPLGADEQGLFGQAQPHQRYRRNGSGVAVVEPVASAAATLDAIDAALRKNTAHVMVHGLFDLE